MSNQKKRNFQIEAFKHRMVVDPKYFKKTWKILEHAIHEIYNHNASGLSFEELYSLHALGPGGSRCREGRAVATAAAISVRGNVPFLATNFGRASAGNASSAWISGALALPAAVQLLSQHLFYWKNPKEQKAIVIIILMAPIYATVSFVGLLDIKGSKEFFMFLESVKECYEALVIAKFLALMYSYLNISISNNIVPDGIKGREIHHSFPMTLFQPRTVRLNHQTLKLLKYWTWQFVVIRPVCSILMITLELLNIYPSWLSWAFTIILNVSVSLALYSLVLFYHVFAKELAPHKPLAKFLCIKGIVFFCFWQGIVIQILVALGVIKANHFWLDVEHLEEAIQNVLVCLEMIVFSVLQQYAFNVSPYSAEAEARLKRSKKNE